MQGAPSFAYVGSQTPGIVPAGCAAGASVEINPEADQNHFAPAVSPAMSWKAGVYW